MDLERFCEAEGIEAEFLAAPSGAETAADAAQALDTSPAQIIKSLVFFLDGDPLLVVVRGVDSVSETKLAEAMHAKECRLAEPDEVEDCTGYAVGAVPPVGTSLTKVIDERVLEQDRVYGGGGARDRLIGLDPRFIVGERDFVEDVVR